MGSRVHDMEAPMPGITPKEHFVRIRGRQSRYPFGAMIKGDYFRLETAMDANRVRSAVCAFVRNHPTRKFTVRLDETGSEWFCRRVQ